MSSVSEQQLEAEREERFERAGRVVWQLAWPAVALNGLQTLNTLLDTYFIGHLPEKAALTAHGAAMNVMFMMFSLAMAISVAATALVARAYGAKSPSEYREAARQSLTLSLLIGLVLSGLCLFVAKGAASIFIPASDLAAQELFRQFLTIYAFGIPASAIITTLGGSFRGLGDTKSPMWISGFQIALHIALNTIFIYGPNHWFPGSPGFGWGLSGAAISLVASSWVSAITYVFWCRRTDLGKVALIGRPVMSWTKRILNIAFPSALQAILRVGSFSFFTLILAKGASSSDALGALRVGIAIESIMFMPAFGFSVAAGALVGQSLGAGKPERAERLGWLAAHYGGIVVLALSIPLFIWAPEVASHLTGHDKPTMAAEAANYIRILIATEVLFAYAMVLIGALQGAGDTRRTLWITIATLWMIRVPLAWALVPIWGSNGAWFAMSASQACQGLLAIWLWKQGHWKTVKV